MALDNCTPMAVWREGACPERSRRVTGVLDGMAVDMTLRLDNAEALPTCPQPQQQQQTALFARDIRRSERPRTN